MEYFDSLEPQLDNKSIFSCSGPQNILSSSSSSFYSHLFNYDVTKMRDRKEVKNRADYTLS